MKYFIVSTLLVLLSPTLYGQIKPTEGGIFSQLYGKEITEYKSKEYIVNEILEVPNKQLIDIEIDAITASKSGELTVIIYNCELQKKRGLVFVFWSDQLNEFNVRYKGYAFRHFEYSAAKDMLNNLETVLEQKKAILTFENGNLSKNAVYKWDDVNFLFYKNEFGSNLIRLFWNNFDSEWNQANLKTTKKRFDKFFNNK
jgi:hypothetical protein